VNGPRDSSNRCTNFKVKRSEAMVRTGYGQFSRQVLCGQPHIMSVVQGVILLLIFHQRNV